jgi:hypothetical protein
MADVNSVRLAEGKARRTPDMRLSNAEARHKTFREGFSVRRVSASSHAAFPRRNCRHSFDLQINKAAPPAGVCPLEAVAYQPLRRSRLAGSQSCDGRVSPL